MNDVIKPSAKRPKETYQLEDDDQTGSADDESEAPNMFTNPTQILHDYNGRHNKLAFGGIATRKPMYPIPEVRGSSDNEVSTALSSATTVGCNYRIFFVVNSMVSLLSFGRFLS